MAELKNFGPLEERVMSVLWERGECRVQDVLRLLDSGLAYTTVMTTMDRLFKKGILTRRRVDRAFIYCPVLTKTEWEKEAASSLISEYLEGAPASRELLISSFVDALGQHDEMALEELERKVRRKRKELDRRSRT